MEKLLKYYLSFFLLLCLISCSKSEENNRQKAEKVFKGGSHLPQGSSKSMTRIQKAIEIDSTYDDAVRELSVAYLKRGMPHKWKPIFDKAVKLNPEKWLGYRGYLYLWFYRDYKKAIADFNESEKINNYIDYPQGHSVLYWKGISYLGLKDYENSIRFFNKHIENQTKNFEEDSIELTAFLYLGIAYYEANEFKNALLCFDKAIEFNYTKYADAKYYKSLIYKQKGKVNEAKELINSAIKDFNSGYSNNRPYVESLRQLYLDDYKQLELSL